MSRNLTRRRYVSLQVSRTTDRLRGTSSTVGPTGAGRQQLVDGVRLVARNRLLSGHLPREPPTFTRAGPPEGTERCAVCDELITAPLVFRLRFANETTLHFHGRCHDAWVAERQALERP